MPRRQTGMDDIKLLVQNRIDPYPTRLEVERRLERRDPVTWQDWTAEAPLTREQTEAFDRDGYLIMKDNFSESEVATLIETAKTLRNDLAESTAEDVITEPGDDAVRTIFRLDAQNPLFRRLGHDRRLAGVARFLLGDEVYIHQSRLNYKPGFKGKEFYWHSDFETWHAEDGLPRMRALSASVLLTDNDTLNGPLMLIPGSHRTFIACAGATPDGNHKTSLKKQEVGVPSDAALAMLAKRHGICGATGRAGTLVLFDCNVMHGSNGNITPFPRSNAFFVFNAVSNAPEAPFAASIHRPDFLARRGPEEPILPLDGIID